MTKIRIYWNSTHPNVDKVTYTEIETEHEIIDGITSLVIYTSPTEYSKVPYGSVLYIDVEET